MKRYFSLMIILAAKLACAQIDEWPLILPPGAEPSASKHNNFGIEDFKIGHYNEAFLHFKQAYAADKTAGEIFFNIGLTLHAMGNKGRVAEQFNLARKYAQGNIQILESKILLDYLKKSE